MYKRVLAVAVIFLMSVVLTGYRGTGVVGAAVKQEGLDSKAEQSKAPEEIVNPHLTHVRFFFQDQQMDFFFGSLILGATVNHGCEIGEAFYTAAQIKDGDAASWQQEWLKTARLVEARGEKALAGGHQVSARDQLQRASYYYRSALCPMPPEDPQFKEIALKSRALLKKAGTLFEPQRSTSRSPLRARCSTDTSARPHPGKPRARP